MLSLFIVCNNSALHHSRAKTVFKTSKGPSETMKGVYFIHHFQSKFVILSKVISGLNNSRIVVILTIESSTVCLRYFHEIKEANIAIQNNSFI